VSSTQFQAVNASTVVESINKAVAELPYREFVQYKEQRLKFSAQQFNVSLFRH
jgi:hypothetical protein